jgi:hypothetical protein
MQKCWVVAILLLGGCSKSTVTIDSPLLPPIVPPPSINVRNYGATGNGSSDDTKAFNLAMDAADSLHLPVFVPIGFYKVAIVLSHDGLSIIGEQQPGEHLTGGTVIIGKISCNNKRNISITNLGIDPRGQLQAVDAGALISGNGIDSVPLHQKFNQISLIGDGFSGYKHGILCQTGSDISIKNIIVSNFYHGIAIRSSNILVDSIQAISCGFTSVVVKSAETYNSHIYNVSVNHVTISGNPNDAYSRGGLILIQSYEDISKTENILVQNINSTNGGISCVAVEQAKGIVDNVTISNCTSQGQGDANTRACYDVIGGSNITFSNCSAVNSLGFGYRSTGAVHNIRVVNSNERNSGIGPWTGTFTYLQLNGIEIVKWLCEFSQLDLSIINAIPFCYSYLFLKTNAVCKNVKRGFSINL